MGFYSSQIFFHSEQAAFAVSLTEKRNCHRKLFSMRKLAISVDKNADLKALRKLEVSGLVELYAVGIEGFENTKKLKNKELPVAVWGSPLTTWGNSCWAGEESKYRAIERIVGRQNHGDCLHLERHIESKRDVFVTDDNDFLSCRDQLASEFNVTILTVSELQQRLCVAPDGKNAVLLQPLPQPLRNTLD